MYIGSDPKKIDRCVDLIHKEFKILREKALSASQLEAAKRQIKGQIGVSSDNRESLTMGMAKSFLQYNRFDSLEEAYARIDALSASELLETANLIFDESKLSSLIYV